MVLYKYREDSPFTEQIFTDKKVWLSNAKGLNDPFECTIEKIASEWIEQKVHQLKMANLTGFVNEALQSIRGDRFFYGLKPRQTKEYIAKFKIRDFDSKYKSMREFIYRKTGREMSNPEQTFENFDKQLNEVGIFSLSETHDNELLWAYYANSSKGIAIGFEVIGDCKLSHPNHCLKVIYSNNKPTFTGEGFKNQISFYPDGKNIQKISFDDSTFKQAISTKNESWFHEREWRYIEEYSGAYDYPGKIVEIIFGLHCPQAVIEKYISLAENYIGNDVEFYKMNISGNKLIKAKYS
ncbi:MAG: DUF2971 domain-containing protein [Flavobacterium sp.]